MHEEIPGPARIPEGSSPRARATETVLVVEDEPAVRASLTRHLERPEMSDREFVVDAKEAFMEKPFTFDEITRKVRLVLKHA